MNVFFSKPVSLRDGSTERHSHVIRSIANYRDLPLWGIVRCFHVPDVIADEARIEFEKRGIPPSLITEVDYSEIQRIRDPVRYSQ